MFSSSQYFSPLATQVFPHLFFFSFLPPHKQVHVKAAGEALKIVKVPKAPKKAGKADEAGEAFKVKGVKIHAKKSKGDGEAVAGEAAAVKHTPKKTAKFAEKVAKLDAKKKVKGGVSTCFAFFCLLMGEEALSHARESEEKRGVGDIFTPKTLRRCRALFSEEEKNSSSFFLTPTPPPPPPPTTLNPFFIKQEADEAGEATKSKKDKADAISAKLDAKKASKAKVSGADALAAAAAAGESGKKMKAPKVYAKKADEAGEALKAKPAKVRRLKKSGARAREECFSSRYLSA